MTGSRKTVAVIGAEGFIGSNLCRHIRESFSDEIVLTALGREDFDLTAPETWTTLPDGTDCLIHAAALLQGDVYDIFSINALPARELAVFCNKRKIRQFIYISTGAVYGTTPEPASALTPVNPSGHYAVSKFLAERILQDTFTGTLQVLRLYFPYGHGQQAPRLFPRLAWSIASGETISCNPGGGPRLSVVHIDDLCGTVIKDFVLGRHGSGIWNIASDTVVSIGDVCRRVADALNFDLRLIEDGAQPDVLSAPYNREDSVKWRPFDVVDILN